MGLLDYFLGKDPTGDWPPSPTAPIDYDFDAHALAGVRLGSPVADFRRLGRAEDTPRARKGSLIYYTRGFQLGLEQGHGMDLLIGFTPEWADPAAEPKPFAGKFRYRGGEVPLNARVTEPQLAAIFGPPKGRKGGDDYTRLTYQLGTVSYDFEFDAAGGLSTIDVTAEDVLKGR